jgi:ABC-type bacteriocin/lantibiotic exporter with double-glycine peptidase domain
MRRRYIRLFAFCLGVAWLAAAAAPADLRLDVPFVRQVKEGCGSASISMVMQYWSRQAGQPPPQEAGAETIHHKLYSREKKGIPAAEMVRYFEQSRYRAFAFRGEWVDLKNHLEKGRPLIVALGPEGRKGPRHYVVVVGLDEQNNVVLVNDPGAEKLAQARRGRFEKDWQVTGNWTLLAVPLSDP